MEQVSLPVREFLSEEKPMAHIEFAKMKTQCEKVNSFGQLATCETPVVQWEHGLISLYTEILNWLFARVRL